MPLAEQEILDTVRPRWVFWLLIFVSVIFPGLKGFVFLLFSDLYLPPEYPAADLRATDPLLYYTIIDVVRDNANGYLFTVAMLAAGLFTSHVAVLQVVAPLAVAYFIILATFLAVELLQWKFYDPVAFVIDGSNLVGWIYIASNLRRHASFSGGTALSSPSPETTLLAQGTAA